ncbi:helix-hairpin-helix domain-containing protein [Virgibacillus ndiopensis]|uniref:helix-hairpin-helix domain-containing protein n=1 Tax=Virgibacillus ndiopensis TaxID=2004408 RepID=UPI000C076303|nr:helix-hairpin-helix domain-containing protein [Virgibacillus ndiopensis]
MIIIPNPTLSLTPDEKTKFRKAKVKISEIHTLSVEQLIEILNISDERANIVKGLSEFQAVPSIGYKLAEKLVYRLNIYSLNDMKDKDGAELFDRLEQCLGVWTDSCVEDQIRCIVHHANTPGSNRQWFDFTKERKEYREKVGFPKDRPRKAWNE